MAIALIPITPGCLVIDMNVLLTYSTARNVNPVCGEEVRAATSKDLRESKSRNCPYHTELRIVAFPGLV